MSHTVSVVQNNIDIWQICIHIANGVMANITSSSPRPCANFFLMVFHEPIMQSIIDWLGHTDDWLWKSSRFAALLKTISINYNE